MTTQEIITLLLQAGSFIAAFAAIAAGIIMARLTKHFGAGVLAFGFKAIAIGILFIAAGIVVDLLSTYLLMSDRNIILIVQILKEILFVIGTYIIVIGSKKTGDKLESLTK